VITTSLPYGNEEREILVIYPFDYPDVEPSVLGPPELLLRHQNRRIGNFCLLEEPAADWWPGMAAAQLVDEELRWLLEDSEAGTEAVAAGEADMPEPLSQHISADASQPVLVSDPFFVPALSEDHGELVLVDAKLGTGHVLVSADGFSAPDKELIARFTGAKGQRHVGTWTALDDGALSPWPSNEEVLAAVEAANPDALRRLRRTLERERKRPQVEGYVGVTFIEEGPRRHEQRRGWVFLHVAMQRNGDHQVVKALRAFAVTAGERERRTPELVGLADARVLLVGAGSLGAPVVLELVKAGVGHIDVIDDDVYDPNNAVRHILAPYWAGTNKAIALAVDADALNPFVHVEAHPFRVGGGRSQSTMLDTLLAEADVVVDATGSQSAARILQRRCKEFAKRLVLASLTAGSYGGEVAVFRPDGPCYFCFVLGQQDGTVPKPAEGPRSNVTPVGCHTPAFSGSGFDATALAALAARMVVQSTGRCSYPESDSDFVVVNFRGADPWRQGHLERHSGCPMCQ
jgi:molybdopterin/thiamine biosynthesis adenylyltransferase